jgi:G3E family GTPase
MRDPRSPLTLLTDFLGAGKTTLLNAVLADAGAGRVAVIVNELGEAGLDHDLIEASEGEVLLMRSGCLCCSVRGDLADTVARLIARWDAGELAFERPVIETTGLADPGPILQILGVDPLLARTTRLGGVVTVADAAHGAATLDAHVEAVSQAAMADLIVLSKTDLVPPAEVLAFEARLRAINPGARIAHSVRGEGVSDRIWGLGGLSDDVAPADIPAWMTGPDALANVSGLARPAPAPPSRHDGRIGTASIMLVAPIPDAVFDLWLDTLIALRGWDILRVKGIVFLEGIDAPFAFHGVQHVFDAPVPLRGWPAGDRRSRIGAIARDATRPELQRSLDMLRGHLPPRRADDIQMETLGP